MKANTFSQNLNLFSTPSPKTNEANEEEDGKDGTSQGVESETGNKPRYMCSSHFFSFSIYVYQYVHLSDFSFSKKIAFFSALFCQRKLKSLKVKKSI